MPAKKIISFLVAALLSALTIYLSFAILIIATFSLSGRTLQEAENEQLMYLSFWILLAIVGASFTFLFWKRNKAFSASGVGLVSAMPLAAALLMAYRAITTIPVQDEFAQDVWSSKEMKPFLMAKSITKSDLLENDSEDDVLSLLSHPTDVIERSLSEKILFYQTDSASWIMRVFLADSRVVNTDLYHPGLSN